MRKTHQGIVGIDLTKRQCPQPEATRPGDRPGVRQRNTPRANGGRELTTRRIYCHHRNIVLYGREQTKPSPQAHCAAYMGAGKQWYPQDTAVIEGDEEMNPTITTGTTSYMGVSGPNHHHRLIAQPIWERASNGILRTQRSSKVTKR